MPFRAMRNGFSFFTNKLANFNPRKAVGRLRSLTDFRLAAEFVFEIIDGLANRCVHLHPI